MNKRKFVFDILKDCRTRLVWVLLLGIFWPLRDIVTPYVIKSIVDAANSAQEQLSISLFRSLIVIVFTWTLMEILMRVQGALIARTLPTIRTKVCAKILAWVKKYPYSFFLNNTTGSLSDKVIGASQGIESLLAIFFVSFVPIASHFVLTLLILATINTSFSLLFLAWASVHIWITWKMGVHSLPKTAALAQIRSGLHDKIVDSFFNIFVVKTFTQEEHEEKYLGTYQAKELNASIEAQKYLEQIRLLLGISSLVMLTSTLSMAYVQWKKEVISIGEVSLIVIFLLSLTSYLWYLSMEVIRFNEEYGRVKDHLDALLSQSKEQDSPHPVFPDSGRIHFKNVCYSYDKPLLKNLSFSIEPGQRVAITGLSGSGKTTLIHLILSHLSAQKGEIWISGVNVGCVSPIVVRTHLAVVPQSTTLFNRSIRENIQYGNLYACEDEIYEAAKIANCHEFISHLPKGYDTLVGEQGDKLSGGQKQRIAIARALLRKSPILLLDEPTSALDCLTAKQTLENILQSIPKSTTLIVITHNPQIASLMNETIEMDLHSIQS